MSSIIDPTFLGIMGGLALMFIIMCVVLQLFARSVAVKAFVVTLKL